MILLFFLENKLYFGWQKIINRNAMTSEHEKKKSKLEKMN